MEIAYKEMKTAQSEMEDWQKRRASLDSQRLKMVDNAKHQTAIIQQLECDAQMILLVFSDLTLFNHSFSGRLESLLVLV